MIDAAEIRGVLDASAVLAFALREPGYEIVGAAFDGGAISSVNWSEVLQKVLASGKSPAELSTEFFGLGLRIVPFTAEDAEAAALLWPATRALGLSLGDRACLTLGLQRRCPVFTADRSWRQLSLDLDIRMIR
ncbi:MAG: PIN domain-containing protein [Chloroflexota bacterium]